MAKQALITPVGTLGWSHIAKRDTEGQYATNKFTAEIRFPKAGADNQDKIDAFIADMNQRAEDAGADLDNPDRVLIKDGDAMKKSKDKDTGKVTDVFKKSDIYRNHWYMKIKTDKTPGVIDTKNNKLPATLAHAGDKVRIIFDPHDYPIKGEFGFTGYLVAVQIIEKPDMAEVNADRAIAALSGDEIEGYEADAEAIDNEVDGSTGDY